MRWLQDITAQLSDELLRRTEAALMLAIARRNGGEMPDLRDLLDAELTKVVGPVTTYYYSGEPILQVGQPTFAQYGQTVTLTQSITHV